MMAAFDRIESGLPQVDEILDHIRIGDNVVWQVSEVNEFRYFAEIFARQAIKDGDWDLLSQLVPQTTLDFFQSREAEPIIKKIRKEANVIHY